MPVFNVVYPILPIRGALPESTDTSHLKPVGPTFPKVTFQRGDRVLVASSESYEHPVRGIYLNNYKSQTGVIQTILQTPRRLKVILDNGDKHEFTRNGNSTYANAVANLTIRALVSRNPTFDITRKPEPGDRYLLSTGRTARVMGINERVAYPGQFAVRISLSPINDGGDWKNYDDIIIQRPDGTWRSQSDMHLTNLQPARALPAIRSGQVWAINRNSSRRAVIVNDKVLELDLDPETFHTHSTPATVSSVSEFSPIAGIHRHYSLDLVELIHDIPDVDPSTILIPVFTGLPTTDINYELRSMSASYSTASEPRYVPFDLAGMCLTQSGRRTAANRHYNSSPCDSCQMRGDTTIVYEHGTSSPVGRSFCTACVTAKSYLSTCGHRSVGSPNTVSNLCIHCEHATLRTSLHSYSHKPIPIFHGPEPLQFGVELEMEFQNTPSSRLQVARDVTVKDFVYCKTDGSLSDRGIEMVTHPFSLEWARDNKSVFDNWFHTIAKYNGDAQTRCGLHIHTSKNGYAADDDTFEHKKGKNNQLRSQQLSLLRVQRLVYENPKHIVHFAGRASDHYASLQMAPYGNYRSYHETGNKAPRDPTAIYHQCGAFTDRELVGLARHPDAIKAQRYAALNFTQDTVEFRIYASTSSLEVFMSKLEFTHAIIQYCNTHRLALKPSFKLFAKWILDHTNEYPNLVAQEGPVLHRLTEGEPVARATMPFAQRVLSDLGVPQAAPPPDFNGLTGSPVPDIVSFTSRQASSPTPPPPPWEVPVSVPTAVQVVRDRSHDDAIDAQLAAVLRASPNYILTPRQG